ncbi:MAG TPA: XrtB/PEP-CTERM-associated transcriptional regulator EpsA [Burkholderiales bacterium]|nr:XrtB/PEP-CTERM-associated transcriptional regulator EpsA [Burkholderiales bacterium]
MTTALSSTLNPAETAQAPILPGSAEAKTSDARSAATDFLQIESIVLNLDASLRVHARAHFFSWTQGLLQSLIRHELLICTLCLGKPPAFRADGFSMTTPEPNLFSDIFLRDTAVAPTLLKAWEERRYQPVIIDVGPTAAGASPAASPALGSGGFTRELERLGATQLLVHGIHDAEGRATSLFVFACRPASASQRQAYLVQLLAPSLHAAWVRTQLTKRAETGGDKAAGGSVLTVRELDILKWIYLGKSNFEIGAILKISPLTVKNHVQKILRKLNVVNRTQAIGKALELRILNP